MALKSLYQVIKGPVISDKAYKLNHMLKKLVLEVHPSANKPMIEEVLQKLFDVKVKSIRIITRKGKVKFIKRRRIKTSDSKRAIITLAEGYSLETISQAGAQTVVPGSETAAEKMKTRKRLKKNSLRNKE